jgi:hypothetical protein
MVMVTVTIMVSVTVTGTEAKTFAIYTIITATGSNKAVPLKIDKAISHQLYPKEPFNCIPWVSSIFILFLFLKGTVSPA